MKISGNGNRVTLTINGKRTGVSVSAGPWIEGVNPDLIKLRCKRGVFPNEIREGLTVENNSDMREDYFEADTVRLLPGHPLYDAAKLAAA